MNQKIPNKYLYLPILILIGYLIIRLIDHSRLIFTFPLDYTNDLSSYITQFFFLFKCGYHAFCPYWYNGVINFLLNPPGWSFFFAPLYLLIKNILLTVYLAIVITFLLGLFAFLFLAKTQKLSRVKGTAMFLFFFANPIAIGNFIKVGRITSMFAWVWFIFLLAILLYYKDKPINKFFLVFIPLYSFLLITHYQEAFLLNIFILSLFLIKPLKEKMYLILCSLASFSIASFWLVPYLLNSTESGLYSFSSWMLDFKGMWVWANLGSVIVSIFFIVLFYFYIKSKPNKRKELFFFLPVLILWFLVTSRLVVLIPYLQYISPAPYTFFFLLPSIFFLMKTKFSKKLLQIIFIGLILLSIIGVTISAIKTPWFIEHTQLEKDTLETLSHVEGLYLIAGQGIKTSYEKAYYCYTPIFMNLSTSSGWYPSMIAKDYDQELFKFHKIFNKKENCQELLDQLALLNTTYVLTHYKDNCDFLEKCLKYKVFEKGEVCLFSTKSQL